MQQPNNTKQRFQAFIFGILLISIISISGFAVYAMQPVSIQTEVKEPLEILDYPTSFSLYPGETQNFNFTVENSASVNYFQEFEFIVNDTDYQKYVTFSNYNYSIQPGIHMLNAWFTISPNAPAANFVITINKKTNTLTPTLVPTATPTPNTNITLTPTLELLAGGTKWAVKEGKSALYINWLDNYKVHITTDGANWDWWMSETTLKRLQTSTIAALESSGFEITLQGDIPNDISGYDLVVIYAYYAVEPHHAQLIKEYVYNGGNVVLMGGSPGYFVSYSKLSSTSTDLQYIEEWFGASSYGNSAGPVRVAFDNPLGTDLSTFDFLFTSSPSEASVSSLSNDANPIAFCDSGRVFAFTHEYGAGRVYYQAAIQLLETK